MGFTKRHWLAHCKTLQQLQAQEESGWGTNQMQNRFSLECIDQSLFVLATQILLVFFSEQNSSFTASVPSTTY